MSTGNKVLIGFQEATITSSLEACQKYNFALQRQSPNNSEKSSTNFSIWFIIKIWLCERTFWIVFIEEQLNGIGLDISVSA